jgi:hypothetical protein
LKEIPMDAHLETLAAWVDAEPVQHGDVIHALETAEGRAYVVDLMALRRLVGATMPQDDAHTVMRPRRWRVAGAAAAAIVCVVSGFAAGRLAAPRPPVPVPEITPAVATIPTTAPQPTRVIRLEEGVDWRETIGGN